MELRSNVLSRDLRGAYTHKMPAEEFFVTLRTQEAFDTVVRGLAAQGKQARTNPWSSCRYRAPDGCRCAVGLLIRPEQYRDVIENRPINFLMEELLEDSVASEFRLLLNHLRDAHDQCVSRRHLRNELRNIARREDLDTAVLEEVMSEAWLAAGSWMLEPASPEATATLEQQSLYGSTLQ